MATWLIGWRRGHSNGSNCFPIRAEAGRALLGLTIVALGGCGDGGAAVVDGGSRADFGGQTVDLAVRGDDLAVRADDLGGFDLGGPPDAAPPCPAAFTPKDRASIPAALDALLCNELRKAYVPGAAAAHVGDAAMDWTGRYGYSDVAKQVPVADATVFQVASVSKSLTAWGAMKLVEQGKLDLDAPIDNYLTRWHLPASKFTNSKVTARRLMSHTAGTTVHGFAGYDPNGPLPTLEQSLDGMNNGSGPVKLFQEPGAGYQYSGGGVTILQLAIEEITQQKFEDYMKAQILVPLGMKSSSFQWEMGLRPLTATAYNVGGAVLPNYLFTEKAAAGLYTTASDLARFTNAFMTGPANEPIGRGVLTPASVMLIGKAVAGGPWQTGSSLQPGLGCFVDTLVNGDPQLLHTGVNLGWNALYTIDLKRRQSLVLLTNGDSANPAIGTVLNTWRSWMASNLK